MTSDILLSVSADEAMETTGPVVLLLQAGQSRNFLRFSLRLKSKLPMHLKAHCSLLPSMYRRLTKCRGKSDIIKMVVVV